MSKPKNKVIKNVTKVQDFYIRNNIGTLTPEELSRELEISVELVNRVIEDEKVKVEEKKKKEETLFSQNLARNKVRGKNIAVIMTAAASQMTDESKKNKKAKNDASYIHKPY